MNPIAYPDLDYNAMICRYGEIATKGENRIDFERRLIASIRRALQELGRVRVLRERGRIFVRRGERREVFAGRECQVLRERMPQVHGLVSASPGFLVAPELPAIEAAVLGSFPSVYAAFAAQVPEPARIQYGMRAHRNNKAFPMTGTELEIHFADRLLTAYPRLQVNLRHAELCVEVEVRRDRAFISYERIKGPGGLPSGSAGPVLALLSGGIDSPVACHQAMKRGCTVDFLTFHSEPYTPPELLSKVARLVRVLNVYQEPGRLIAVNLLAAQKEIREKCLARFRTILYRRLMMRVAAAVGRALGAKALVTGDNVGQVASQTLENLAVVTAATQMLILRPVLTFDKVETTALAARLGTLPISEEPVPDSCTVFAASSPATATTLAQLQREEACLDLPRLLRQCAADACLVSLETLERSPVPGLDAALAECLSAGAF